MANSSRFNTHLRLSTGAQQLLDSKAQTALCWQSRRTVLLNCKTPEQFARSWESMSTSCSLLLDSRLMPECWSIWQELNANPSDSNMRMSLQLNMLQDLLLRPNRNTLKKVVPDLSVSAASWVGSRTASPICSLLSQVEHLLSGKLMLLERRTRRSESSLRRTIRTTLMSNRLLDLLFKLCLRLLRVKRAWRFVLFVPRMLRHWMSRSLVKSLLKLRLRRRQLRQQRSKKSSNDMD